MASPTRWAWVWVNSRSWWWTGRPGMVAAHGVTKSQTQLSNWTELNKVLVQSLSHVWLCVTMDCSTPGFPVLCYLLEFAQTHVHWVSDAIQPPHPLPTPSPPASIFPSLRVFSNESALRIRWSKYWSFSFSISPSSEYSGLISFWIDWFDLLTAQRTLESLLQHHSLKASILWPSAFLMAQFLTSVDNSYMTTGKNTAFTIWTFAGKMTSLLCNILSRFVIAFLLRSKHLFIHGCSHSLKWFLEPKKIKSVSAFNFSPDGTRYHDLSFLNVEFYASFLTLLCHFQEAFHFQSLEWYHLHIWGYWYFSQKSWFRLELHPAQHFGWCSLHIS